MTSKEALEELLYYATLDDSGFEPAMKRYAQYIKNDLEVLEIIKENHFEIDKDGNIYVGNIGDVLLGIEDYYVDMKEKYNKIKEWVKGE